MDGWMVVASSFGLRSSLKGERERGREGRTRHCSWRHFRPPARPPNGSSHIPPCINFARILSDPPDRGSSRLASGRDRPADRQNLGASIVHAVKSVM